MFRDAQGRVLFTPCHTVGHVLYLIEDPEAEVPPPGALFTGDTLFIGGECCWRTCRHRSWWQRASERHVFRGGLSLRSGCGKFFSGTPQQMYNALIKNVGSLPDSTRVYCGHEYSLNNLRYALHVEPDNADVARKLEWARKMDETDTPTVPSTRTSLVGGVVREGPW